MSVNQISRQSSSSFLPPSDPIRSDPTSQLFSTTLVGILFGRTNTNHLELNECTSTTLSPCFFFFFLCFVFLCFVLFSFFCPRSVFESEKSRSDSCVIPWYFFFVQAFLEKLLMIDGAVPEGLVRLFVDDHCFFTQCKRRSSHCKWDVLPSAHLLTCASGLTEWLTQSDLFCKVFLGRGDLECLPTRVGNTKTTNILCSIPCMHQIAFHLRLLSHPHSENERRSTLRPIPHLHAVGHTYTLSPRLWLTTLCVVKCAVFCYFVSCIFHLSEFRLLLFCLVALALFSFSRTPRLCTAFERGVSTKTRCESGVTFGMGMAIGSFLFLSYLPCQVCVLVR